LTDNLTPTLVWWLQDSFAIETFLHLISWLKNLVMRKLIAFMFLAATPLAAQTFDEILAQGDKFYDASNYAEAIKFFTQAISLDKKNVKGYWYRADAYRQNQQYAEGAADYTRALEIEPENVKFLTRRGDCYYNTNQFQLALKDYARGLELENTNATLWLYRGDCYAKLGEKNSACDDYQKAFELGDKSAKGQARQIECDWVLALTKPCPTGEAAISKIEVDPFTGAVIISKGLGYRDFEIETDAKETTITAPEFAIGESFNFRINWPTNFCIDDNDEAFFGIGLILTDDTGKELANVGNIYQEDQGVAQEALKYLSAKLDFDAPMEKGKNYAMAVRYFDTRGNGEVLLSMPFKIMANTRTNSNTFTSKAALGPGVTSGSVGIEPILLEIKQQGKSDVVKNQTLARSAIASFTVTARNPATVTNYKMRLVDSKGKVVYSQTGKPVVKAAKIRTDLALKNQAAGAYQLWIGITDEAGEQSLGLVVPVKIK
jgi:tetratricopeptide (TPR) repeat protein